MKQINWDEAPDDAEAGHAEAREQLACWYRVCGLTGSVKVMLASNYGSWYDMGGRRDFPYGAILRPSK